MHRHTHEPLPVVWRIGLAVGLAASLWVAVAFAAMLVLLLAQAVLLLS